MFIENRLILLVDLRTSHLVTETERGRKSIRMLAGTVCLVRSHNLRSGRGRIDNCKNGDVVIHVRFNERNTLHLCVLNVAATCISNEM